MRKVVKVAIVRLLNEPIQTETGKELTTVVELAEEIEGIETLFLTERQADAAQITEDKLNKLMKYNALVKITPYKVGDVYKVGDDLVTREEDGVNLFLEGIYE